MQEQKTVLSVVFLSIFSVVTALGMQSEHAEFSSDFSDRLHVAIAQGYEHGVKIMTARRTGSPVDVAAADRDDAKEKSAALMKVVTFFRFSRVCLPEYKNSEPEVLAVVQEAAAVFGTQRCLMGRSSTPDRAEAKKDLGAILKQEMQDVGICF